MVKAVWHSSSVKELIVKRIHNVRNALAAVPSLWGEAFFWQTVCSLAEEEKKSVWAKLQDPAGKIKLPADDAIRAFGQGERILKTAGTFTCKVRVDAPVRAVDMDILVTMLAKRFRVKQSEIEMIVEACKVDHKARLTKRILENGTAV